MPEPPVNGPQVSGPPVSQETSNIRFGVFEANLRSAELRKNGHKIKLQDQPFQLLAMLLERPGEVTTREEMRARLWPIDTFVNFDHGLNAAIKRLRDALGDSAENPRFVETLSRRGYRFIAPVHPSSYGVNVKPESNPVTPPQSRKYWRIAIAAALLLIGNGVGWVAARHFNPEASLSELRLTDNNSDDPILNAVISPDAKYLVFADSSGLFLRVVATGETHSVALPQGFRSPRPSAWFPDGSHVLVTKSAGSPEGPSMWSVSVLGGAPLKLMDNASARAVSPDGSRIAFVRGDVLHEEIWAMSADGDHLRKVAGDAGDVFGAAAWSPDNRLLALVRFNYKSVFKASTASLLIAQPDGGLQSPILSDPRLGDALAWSPDGRLIYSLSEPLPSQNDSNLWALAIDPRSARAVGQPVRLTNGPDRKLRLSLSADGKQLAFLRWRGEPHVYVAEVDPSYDHLSAPHPLSLDEGRNLPSAWTPDGKSILFTSDRDGPSHIFKQALDQPAPDLLVGGPDSVQIARLNPDGSELLYLMVPPQGDTSGVGRLMRMPISGGSPRLLLQESQLHNFQCARLPSRTCLFSRSTPDSISFFAFDPVTGSQQSLPIAGLPPNDNYNWSLSPDGSMLALADWRRGPTAEILLFSLKKNGARTLSLPDWAGIWSVDWAADGRSLWVSAIDPAGVRALLNVDLHGRAKPLLQDLEKEVGWAIPSPDGRHIAFWEAGGSSNAWLLRGF